MNKGLDLHVPISGQVTGIEEEEAIIRVAKSRQYASYKLSEQFEHEFSSYVGKRYGVFVNSGSSANLLAVSALFETSKQSHIVLPGVMFPTTLNPYLQKNKQIILRDVELDTLQCMDLDYGVHQLGNYSNVGIIEDSCDAMFPGKYLGEMQTFSFFPAHHMTTGEGGMITTDDPDLYRTLKSLRDWGRDCWCLPGHDNTCGHRFDGSYDHKYTYSRIGYNLKATEIQAAIGIEQLKKLPGFTKIRIRNFNHLYKKLKKFEQYFILPKSVLPDTPWFGFPLTLKDGVCFTRGDIVNFLNNKGIGTRPIFGGNITKQPAYKDVKFIIDEPLTNCDKVHNDSFWVGSWHGLSLDQLDYTVSMIQEFLDRVDQVRYS
ncbi:MAG: DegT/DnrJ/EryC1/StrS family aminotransferase [Clostridia bacterium]